MQDRKPKYRNRGKFKRSENINIKVTSEEKEFLKEHANKLGVTVSELVFKPTENLMETLKLYQ